MTPTRCAFDLSRLNQLSAPNYAGDAVLFGQAKAAGWVAMMHKLKKGASFSILVNCMQPSFG